MNNINFDAQEIESISKILGDYTTGSKITSMLKHLKLNDMDNANAFSTSSTKWKRIYNAAVYSQNNSVSGYALIQIIEWIFKPISFISETNTDWINARNSINQTLQYFGLFVDDNGKVIKSLKVESFTEGKIRFNSLKSRLLQLDIHPRIMSACTPEILQDNYFHLIFESSKIVLTKIREISGLDLDGNSLVNECFDINKPRIVLNALQTDSEKSMYRGLKSLLNEIVYLYRNPKAHEPKFFSETNEMDAIYALITMSKALNVLDICSRNYTIK